MKNARVEITGRVKALVASILLPVLYEFGVGMSHYRQFPTKVGAYPAENDRPYP